MLKLIKYELRKNRPLLLIMLTVIAGLEVYFLLSAAFESRTNAVTSAALMAFAAALIALSVFILGVSSYSRELNQKSSYLIFMTPHGTFAIVASKILFTLVIGLLFAAILGGLLVADYPVLLKAIGQEWRGYLNLFGAAAAQSGVDLSALLLTVLFYVLMVFLELLSTVSVAYFAITLSATFLQNRKGKGVVSFLLFALISYGLSRLSGLFISDAPRNLHYAAELVPYLAPVIAQDATIVLLSMFGCARMLDRGVNL